MPILNLQTMATANGIASTGELVFSVGGQILEGVSSVKFGDDDGDGKLPIDSVVVVTITCAVTLGKGGVCQS